MVDENDGQGPALTKCNSLSYNSLSCQMEYVEAHSELFSVSLFFVFSYFLFVLSFGNVGSRVSILRYRLCGSTGLYVSMMSTYVLRVFLGSYSAS